MKIWIDRQACTADWTDCESFLSRFTLDSVREWPCVVAYRDDGSDTLTVFFQSEDHDEMLVIPRRLRRTAQSAEPDRGSCEGCKE